MSSDNSASISRLNASMADTLESVPASCPETSLALNILLKIDMSVSSSVNDIISCRGLL